MITNLKEIKIFSGNSNKPLAEAIAKELNVPLGEIEVGCFSDGETSVHVKESRQHYGNGTTVNTQKIVHNDNTEFTFYLIVRGDSVEEIKDKVRILALAADDEVSESDIFINLETSLVELVSSRNDIEIIKSTEKEQIIIISCVLGVIVALILVFVLNSLDKTVKHKEELEEISKVPVLSFIEEQGGAD